MQISSHQESPKQARKSISVGRTACSTEIIASSGVTFQLWRLYQHAWLVCLIFPLASVIREPISPWQVILRLFALLMFGAGYTWLMWPHPASQQTRARTHPRLAFLCLSVLGIFILALSLAYGPAWFWLFIGISAMAGVLLPLRGAFATVVFLTLLPLFLTLKMHGGLTGVDLWWLIALMLLVRGLGLDMIGVARMGSAIRELHTARRELARLAVLEERERLSRDLHDLLGQTLSVITLKSEVARGLIQEEPNRCAQELAEIEQVSRQMLREVRKTVAGYRQPTLVNELEGARQLLEATGVECVVEQTTGDLPPALDAILAWIIREGVTNVIRHSRARQCLIRLASGQGMVEAVILNDGEWQEDYQDERTNRGNGLAGLRERVATLGGTMEVDSLKGSEKKHFRLWVELPLQNHAEREKTVGAQEERA